MDYLKFELDKSLMDRFIETHFDKIKIQILYGPFGEGATLESDQNIRDIREEWFADDSVKLDYANIRKRLKWKLNDSPQIDGDIKDAIKIVFASLNSVNVPDSLKSVSSIFTDMVRLSVNEEHTVTTYSKYRTCINSSEAVLKCILWQLGFIYVEESGKTIQLKGENVQKYSNDKTKDITLDSINCFLSNRFRRFSVTSLQNVSLLCLALKSHRNKETHSTYYTDPERFWRRLIYLLYDYITLTFFFMKYLRGGSDGSVIPIESGKKEVIEQALEKAKGFIDKTNKIDVVFVYPLSNDAIRRRLAIAKAKESVVNGCAQPPQEASINGKRYFVYKITLERDSNYYLQCYQECEAGLKPEGEPLEFKSISLYDGAVIHIELPTKDIPYPSIKSIIAKSTGLIEDSENRTIIEKLLEKNISDDSFRSKLRVLLLLDEGDKETIVKEFVEKEGSLSEDLKSEDFKEFVEAKSDGVLAALQNLVEDQFKGLDNSLRTNQEKLREIVLNAVSQIDLRTILTSNTEIKKELNNLRDDIHKWNELNSKSAAKSAEMNEKLLKELKTVAIKSDNSTETINLSISQLSKVLQDENKHWKSILEGIDWKVKALLTMKIVGIIFIVLAVGTFCFLRNSSGPCVYKLEKFSEVAHNWCGNENVAYERARYLESMKEYSEAAKWYMEARKCYADILSSNSSDSIRALNMTQMLMRGKGGIIDTKGAEKYAEMAKRYDILAYLAAVNGDAYKSKDIVNNYQGEITGYLELADALSTLLYPRSVSNFEQIDKSWGVVDSLASTTNIATEEALSAASSLTHLGVVDRDGNYVLAPSLYDALAYATDADTLFNSLGAQAFLAAKYESMGLQKDADRYNQKANDNGRKGYGEIVFSHERINELGNDPQALIVRAHNNSEKGYTDYRMTAYYYHKADSLNSIVHQYNFGAEYYSDWTNLVVKAEDLTTIEQLMPLIRKDYPDSMRLAIADYIMAIKLSNEVGTASVDSIEIKSGEYLFRAASKGLEDAQVAVGILWDLQNRPEGMKLLERLAYRDADKIHPWAARYLLSKGLKNNMIGLKLLSNLGDDEFALFVKLSNMAFVSDLLKFDKETLRSVRTQIDIVLSQQSNLTKFAYFFGKLAEIEYILDNVEAADFYIELANHLSPKLAYTSIFGISEIARAKGDDGKAAFFAGRFAKVFFGDNGKVLDEVNRSVVVEHFYHLYPEILDVVKEDRKYDFTKGIWFFSLEGFDWERDFSTYESPVKRLNIELPDYERYAFPISMKYFE